MPQVGGRDSGTATVEQIQQHYQCVATTSYDARHFSILAPDPAVNSTRNAFWTSTGLYPQQIRLDCMHKTDCFAVTGISAEFWQVQEVRICVIGENFDKLFETTKTFDRAPQGAGPEFQGEHISIPNTEATIAVVFEILKGYTDFCALRKCRILGRKLERNEELSDEHSQSENEAVVEPFKESNIVNNGQRSTTVVAAVYGANATKGAVRGNHTLVVPRGRKKHNRNSSSNEIVGKTGGGRSDLLHS